MKKLLFTFVFGIIKDKLNESVSSATIGFLTEYRKKIVTSFLFMQLSVVLLAIASYQLINEITLSILNNTFPTPQIYVAVGISLVLIVINLLVIKSLKNTYRDYITRTNFIIPNINDHIFSPLTRQLKIERSKYESTHQL